MSKKTMLKGFIWQCDSCPLWTQTKTQSLLDYKEDKGGYMQLHCPECKSKMHVVYMTSDEYLNEERKRIYDLYPNAPRFAETRQLLRLQGRLRN